MVQFKYSLPLLLFMSTASVNSFTPLSTSINGHGRNSNTNIYSNSNSRPDQNNIQTIPMSQPSTSVTLTSSTSSALYMNKKNKKKRKPSSSSSSSKGFASSLRAIQMDAFQYAGSIKPGQQSPQKVVLDENIMKPDYAEDGKVSENVNVNVTYFDVVKILLLLH